MPGTTKTYHDGANDERTAVLSKVRRMLKAPISVIDCREELAKLEKWLLTRSKRNKAKKGGL